MHPRAFIYSPKRLFRFPKKAFPNIIRLQLRRGRRSTLLEPGYPGCACDFCPTPPAAAARRRRPPLAARHRRRSPACPDIDQLINMLSTDLVVFTSTCCFRLNLSPPRVHVLLNMFLWPTNIVGVWGPGPPPTHRRQGRIYRLPKGSFVAAIAHPLLQV